ncbi:MAG: NADH dehydrogenase (quinone) subunit D, partial [Acinetobacter pseudolwoffii]
HRGVEKMAERQTWHSFIPYTDRVDYLGGCAQNMPYVMGVEQMAGITVPDRAQCIRVMMSELFRINNHLLFIGTAIQDAGGMTPVFYMFADRQKIYDAIEAITGYRMHPAWFRIGGTAHDLPNNWQHLIREILDWMPKRMNEYYTAALRNSVFMGRTQGVAQYDAKSALAWGVTGTGLRATGIDFDVRKYRPYSGYENYDFEVPLEYEGDAYARVMVHFREIEESLKIVKQCLDNMPSGAYKADHPLAVPPPKDKTLQDIETLITHFLSVSWGPVMPAGEASVMAEVVKGASNYYLTSDKSTMSYRTRIRTPTFTHLQQMPSVINGSLMSDLIIYLATIDVVMADVDR